MREEQLVIIFNGDQAFLCEYSALSLAQLGLPDFAQAFKPDAYWVIRVIRYFESEKRLYCDVISYQLGKAEIPEHQIALADELAEIRQISFRSIATAGLMKTIATFKEVLRKELPSFVEEEEEEKVQTHTPIIKTPEIPEKVIPERRTIKESFSVPLKEVSFRLGGVSVERKITGLPNTIQITIPNYDIREEFDAIKNYFANVLKTRRIQVNVEIELEGEDVVSIVATSPEIERINRQIIDNVKFEFVRTGLKKKIPVEVDKSLFTMDEYLSNFDEKLNPRAFYQNEKELFEDLISISKTKHYRHLRFLSNIHAHDVMKLRFIHKPLSFVFLIPGVRNYHIVWETLDTAEATYVWHVDKNLPALKLALQKIEDILNVIKVQGKSAYISSSEDAYRRIFHDYSDLVDGFVKWKGELENVLT